MDFKYWNLTYAHNSQIPNWWSLLQRSAFYTIFFYGHFPIKYSFKAIIFFAQTIPFLAYLKFIKLNIRIVFTLFFLSINVAFFLLFYIIVDSLLRHLSNGIHNNNSYNDSLYDTKCVSVKRIRNSCRTIFLWINI